MTTYESRYDTIVRLSQLEAAVRRMAEADDRYGTGFYNDPEWRAAYDEARRLAGREVKSGQSSEAPLP